MLENQRVKPCLQRNFGAVSVARLPASSRRSTLPASHKQDGTLPPRLAACQDVAQQRGNTKVRFNDNEPTAHHDGIKHGAFHASRNPWRFPSRSLPEEVKLRRRS